MGESLEVTEGLRVSVASRYLAEQSDPRRQRYVFAYTVRLTNEGTVAAQLRTRHWIIKNGNGEVEEVRGPGVVGEQPNLRYGEAFEYTSHCVLATPRGSMRGSYRMMRPDGTTFDAAIGEFVLSLPDTLN
jgi:ApaG protein